MRIGIDARLYSATGIGRYTRNLTGELSRLDKANDYFIFVRNLADLSPLPKNFHYVRANFPHYSISEQTKFNTFLARHKLDLVHFTHFNRPVFFRGKSVVTIHDLILHRLTGTATTLLHKFFYRVVIKQSVKQAVQIIAVSQATKNDIIKTFKVPEDKVKVIYEGWETKFQRSVSREKIDSVLKKYAIFRPYILYVGVWRTHKNLSRLAQAFDKLYQSVKIKPYLVLTGQSEPAYSNVVEGINSVVSRPAILTPGIISENDLPVFYKGAEFLVLPSLYEGFGLPVLEAMACGTPVACSNTTSLPEVAGDAALYFNPERVEDISRVMTKLYSDNKLKKLLSQKGLEQAKKFSWAKTAKETLEVYNKILNSKSQITNSK